MAAAPFVSAHDVPGSSWACGPAQQVCWSKHMEVGTNGNEDQQATLQYDCWCQDVCDEPGASSQVSGCTDERFMLPSTPAGCESSCVSGSANTSVRGPDRDPSPFGSSAFNDSLDRYRHHQGKEQATFPLHGYLQRHGKDSSPESYLTAHMRMIVVSWMVEVGEEFSSRQETLHLAVALLDRFLSATEAVPRCVLQLVAVATFMVASKELEVVQPSVEQMTAVAANCFQASDLLRMERILLDTLDFRLQIPTPSLFLQLFACADLGLSPLVLALTQYILDLALLHYEMLAYTPSALATSALLLSMLTLGETSAWHLVLAMSGHTPQELQECLQACSSLHQAATWPASAAQQELLAPVRSKYAVGPYGHIFAVAPLMELPLQL